MACNIILQFFFTAKKLLHQTIESLLGTLLIYRQQLFPHIISVLQTDVNSALLSSILPTRISCARESSLTKAFFAFSYAAIASAEASAGNLGIPDLYKQHHEHRDVATRVQFAASIYSNLQLPQAFQYEL
ncbi:hypothetical protein TNCT_470671 [Trichonephila clavata]|uniref:Uncharacterized protein n=1 Tax=Trichonephila clavata TaxID=2740835 RepID=A0A8X6HNF1_TRICU|nr:hypothetical protein TNCT_470671 [Trichonephila clavata]